MTLSLPDPQAAREWCRSVRAGGQTLGFVPTMGALHEGHLSLVRRALEENDRACVSLFVNPLQFDEADDFERYPRDPERDRELLAGVSCDMVFSGTLAQFFPEAGEGGEPERVDPGPAAAGLEGEHRTGHFEGVATIVRRLFEVVRPTRAYFGSKDFQQTLVVRHLVRAGEEPAIRVVETVRDPGGLALSSRNARLREGEREEALALSRGLFAARRAWAEGERCAERLTALLREPLAAAELAVEYAELRDPEDWGRGPLSGPLERAQALVAARVGAVRLIDNLRLDCEET